MYKKNFYFLICWYNRNWINSMCSHLPGWSSVITASLCVFYWYWSWSLWSVEHGRNDDRLWRERVYEHIVSATSFLLHSFLSFPFLPVPLVFGEVFHSPLPIFSSFSLGFLILRGISCHVISGLIKKRPHPHCKKSSPLDNSQQRTKASS